MDKLNTQKTPEESAVQSLYDFYKLVRDLSLEAPKHNVLSQREIKDAIDYVDATQTALFKGNYGEAEANLRRAARSTIKYARRFCGWSIRGDTALYSALDFEKGIPALIEGLKQCYEPSKAYFIGIEDARTALEELEKMVSHSGHPF